MTPRDNLSLKAKIVALYLLDGHPFSLREAHGDHRANTIVPGQELSTRTGSTDTLASLMEYGGFPEPFLSHSARTYRRWQRERLERFFREEVRDLATVRDLSSLQLLADVLPERVASPLSLNALREDIEVSHRALTHWIDIFAPAISSRTGSDACPQPISSPHSFDAASILQASSCAKAVFTSV